MRRTICNVYPNMEVYCFKKRIGAKKITVFLFSNLILSKHLTESKLFTRDGKNFSFIIIIVVFPYLFGTLADDLATFVC